MSKGLPRFFKANTIRHRFMIPLMILTFVVMVSLAAIDYTRSARKAEVDLKEKIGMTSELAAQSFSNPLWNYNDESMDSIAKAIMRDPEIGLISIRDKSGNPVYNNARFEKEYGREYLALFEAPVTYQDNTIGVVSVGVTSYYRMEILRQNMIHTAWSTVLLVLVSVLAISWISRKVTGPIALLEAGTEEIARGNLQKRIFIEDSDEISRLAEKFNAMADSLSTLMRERDDGLKELSRLNDTLEDRNRELVREIQIRIQAQDAVAYSEEKFAKAFRHSAEVIGLLRRKDRLVVEVSDSFYACFGHTRKEIIGNTMLEFGLWENDVQRSDLFNRTVREGSFRNEEVRWLTKSGDVRIGLLSEEMIDIQSEPHVLFVWHDISDRKASEEALQTAYGTLERKVEERTAEVTAANEELLAINEELMNALDKLKRTQQQLVQSQKMAALGSMVAGMAHEINTPVGILVTTVSYLSRELKELKSKFMGKRLEESDLHAFFQESDESLVLISNNLERTDMLIRSFKQLSSDQTSDERRVFDVKAYLNELVLGLTPILRKTLLNLTIECPEHVELFGNPGAFAQIFTNLINNSIRHGYDPGDMGELHIEILSNDGELQMRYSDDGKGIDPNILDRIYDPFFTTKRGSEGGMGMGLNLVYNLVTQTLDGEIRCSSEPGSGVLFEIVIPYIRTKG